MNAQLAWAGNALLGNIVAPKRRAEKHEKWRDRERQSDQGSAHRSSSSARMLNQGWREERTDKMEQNIALHARQPNGPDERNKFEKWKKHPGCSRTDNLAPVVKSLVTSIRSTSPRTQNDAGHLPRGYPGDVPHGARADCIIHFDYCSVRVAPCSLLNIHIVPPGILVDLVLIRPATT